MSLALIAVLLSGFGRLWAAAGTSVRGRGLVVERSDWWDNPLPPGSANILLPNGSPVILPKTTMAFEIERFLDSRERPPAAFGINQVHFVNGSSQVRSNPSNRLDDLAAVLVAYLVRG